MISLEWLAQPAGAVLTLTLLHFLWQGLLVALILALIVELLCIRRVETRYACSLAAFLLMAACPVATWSWLTFAQEPGQLSTAQPAVAGATAAASPTSPLPLTPLSRAWWLEVAQPYALAAWLTGVTIFAGRLAAGIVGLARLRRSRLPLSAEWIVRVERIGRGLRMNAAPLVYLSQHAAEAMAVGILRPLVLLPASWAAEMPPVMLEAVIAHELAHLRRHDLWVILLQRTVETLLFYHPAVWWLSRRLRIERELCADNLAVAATSERLVYAQALEYVASQRWTDGRTALAAFARGEKDMRLLQRVRNVLGQPSGEQSRLWPAGVASLVLPVLLWAISPGASGPAFSTVNAEDQRNESAAAEDDLLITLTKAQRERRREAKEREEDPEKAVDEAILKRREAVLRERAILDKASNARFEELTDLVERLSKQVAQLQAEVAELRAEKVGAASTRKPNPKVAADRNEFEPKVRLEFEPKVRTRKPAAAESTDEDVKRKKSAIAEGFDEALARKIKAATAQAENDLIDKDALKRAIQQAMEAAEKAKAEGLRAAEIAKEHADRAAEKVKAEIQALEQVKREKEEVKREQDEVKREKEEFQREQEKVKREKEAAKRAEKDSQ